MRGNQNLFGTVAVSAVAVVLLFSGPTIVRGDTTNLNAGESINLATVINNGLSVQIGDKVFGDFAFTYNDFGAPDVDLVSSNINVKALANDVGFGLEFQEPLIAVNTKTKDVTFQYTAEVAPEYSNLISDIHLLITGSAGGIGSGTVNEVVFNDGFNGTQVGQVGAYVANPTSVKESSNNIAPVVKLWVQKDVAVSGHSGGPGSFATITILDQTFSQIPEPSTVLLVGLGLLGVVALKRKS
jgi:hypothetical protein